jgi:adhesin/invasin
VSNGSITASSGSSATTITVTARDALGQVISGATVVVSAGGSGNNLQQPGAPTDAAGQAVGTLSATGAGSRTISATINGILITETQVVDVSPGSLDPSSSTATVPNGQAGSATTIVVQGRDQFGNPRQSGGGSGSFLVTGANFRIGGLTDQGDGTYTLQYTPTSSGVDQISIFLNLQAIQGSPYTSTVN